MTQMSNASAVNVSSQFDDFIDIIKLDGDPAERIKDAINGVSKAAASGLDLEVEDVIVQGSFANGTAVVPVGEGAYDVDLVLPCITEGTGAVAALDAVEKAFLENGNYSGKVCEKSRNRCVRLNYVDDKIGAFHVDVVPARPAKADSPAPLEVPSRTEKSWNETAPAEYTKWAKDEGPEFADTVMILKRWRDENQGVRSAIKSITLQVLVAEHLTDEESQAGRLASTLRNIANDLLWRATPPALPNPVLKSENLSDRWKQGAFEDFKEKISEAAAQAANALHAEDLITACDEWKTLLGNDFPEAPATEHDMKLSDTSHAHSYADKGWRRAANPAVLEIQAHKVRIRKLNDRYRPYNEGDLLTASDRQLLRFQTLSPLPEGSNVYWQVVNTGMHALKQEKGRGGFIESRPLGEIRQSPRATASTWEGLEYTGVHQIRVIAVKDNVVVAESQWLNVAIRARGVPFRHWNQIDELDFL